MLLSIDPVRLTAAEVRVEPVGDDTYPHVYGPIDRGAVVDVTPLDRRGRPETLMSVWVKGMAVRMGLALLAMAALAALLWALGLTR